MHQNYLWISGCTMEDLGVKGINIKLIFNLTKMNVGNVWCKPSPANEKLYRVWLLRKAPGHSCWTLSFFTSKFRECIWLGGNPADLKLSSSFFRVFSSFQLSCTPFLYSWTFYPQLYLFSLAHYFLAFFFSPCSGPCFCQFHARPVLGESPRALETIRRLFPLPKTDLSSS